MALQVLAADRPLFWRNCWFYGCGGGEDSIFVSQQLYHTWHSHHHKAVRSGQWQSSGTKAIADNRTTAFHATSAASTTEHIWPRLFSDVARAYPASGVWATSASSRSQTLFHWCFGLFVFRPLYSFVVSFMRECAFCT